MTYNPQSSTYARQASLISLHALHVQIRHDMHPYKPKPDHCTLDLTSCTLSANFACVHPYEQKANDVQLQRVFPLVAILLLVYQSPKSYQTYDINVRIKIKW